MEAVGLGGSGAPHLKKASYARSEISPGSIGEALVTYMLLVSGWHCCRLAAGRCSHSLRVPHRLRRLANLGATHPEPVRCPFQSDSHADALPVLPAFNSAVSAVFGSQSASPSLSRSLSLLVSRGLWKLPSLKNDQ